MTRHLFRTFIAALLLTPAAFAAEAPKATTPAPKASAAPVVKLSPTDEIFLVYEIMCVKPGGKLEKAKPAIAELEKANTVKAVPAADAEKLFRKGDSVWATKTPSGTKMFVVYDPAGICALHIEQADPRALKASFVQYTGNVQKGMKGRLIKKADDKVQEDSKFSYYIVTKAGAKKGAGFGLSTSEAAAKKSPQHLLTFNIAKPE